MIARISRGFTLVELLVVITIMVVLLTLLAPAMDRAIYAAELAVCGSNLKAIGGGAVLYAAAEKRKWPFREQVATNGNIKPNQTSKLNPDSVFKGFDDLPRLAAYFDVNGTFNDPLNVDVDWEAAKPDSTLEFDYWLWFSWRWRFQGTWDGMNKIGDRFTWGLTSATGPHTYAWSLLASDYDHSFAHGGSHHAHPDRDGVLHLESWQDAPGALGPAVFNFTLSRWASVEGQNRGEVETQAVLDDGGVVRYVGERWDEVRAFDSTEDRFVGAPVTNDGTLWPDLWINLPKP